MVFGEQDWAEFQRRATNTFNEHLKAYKVGIDAKLQQIGFRPAPKLREADHFRLLALYQVRGWSPAKIANDLSETSGRVMTEKRCAEMRAIKRKAQLISLTLRPNNKGKGKKTRKVARDRAPKFGFAYMT